MIKRRRMLSILAGVAVLPVIGAGATEKAINSSQPSQWHGIALGAEARIILDHPNADRLITRAVDEISRLEKIFSLYLADSQLSLLNREGKLRDPSFEMIELLSICSNLHARTKGAFDPTVQALWSLYARQYSMGKKPTQDQISAAKKDTGWEYVTFSADHVSLSRPGVNLTLNGIAQGFIADKITKLFASEGVSNVLVNTGEISALGHSPEGEPWQIKRNDERLGAIPLSNAAIATSAPLGTAFDGDGKIGHIIDPRTGHPGSQWKEVSVISSSAARADGLSTAFCLMNSNDIEAAKGGAMVLLS